jgi:hypothetical protein
MGTMTPAMTHVSSKGNTTSHMTLIEMPEKMAQKEKKKKKQK